MPDAIAGSDRGQDGYYYIVKSMLGEIENYYQTEMIAQGWKLEGRYEKKYGQIQEREFLNFDRETTSGVQLAYVIILPQPAGFTGILVDWGY